jgi:hypothetical protein
MRLASCGLASVVGLPVTVAFAGEDDRGGSRHRCGIPIRLQPVRHHRGVVTSWSLDLTAAALVDADLKQFAGRVSDSDNGRWTIKAAIVEAVPVLSIALDQCFKSRGASDYQDRLLPAMRFQSVATTKRPVQ